MSTKVHFHMDKHATNLVDVGCNVLVIDLLARYTILIYSKASQQSTRACIDLLDTITDDAYYNSSPRASSPSRLVGGLHIVNVFKYANQRPSE